MHLPNVVVVAVHMLLNDQLGVVQNEGAEKSRSSVQLELEHGKGAEEYVQERRQYQYAQTTSEDTYKKIIRNSVLNSTCK